MNLYLVGGEDHEFTPNSGTLCTVDTATTAQRRSSYARCSLKVGGTGLPTTAGWVGAFVSAQNLFYMTARWGWSVGGDTFNGHTACDHIAFLNGVVRRLILTNDLLAGGVSANFWRLSKRNAAGTTTVLQTSSTQTPIVNPSTSAASPAKIDIFVNYAVAGQVIVWIDGTQVINYSGDVTTDSVTSLDGVSFGTHSKENFGNAAATVTSFWSEVVVSDIDTRSFSLCTLVPNANGNTFSFSSGSFADIDETITDDTNFISSTTANQIAEVTITAPTPGGAIRALVVSSRAQKGATGPQHMEGIVRTGSADYTGTSQTLPAALGLVQDIFYANPASGLPWVIGDITAVGFNIGVKSLT